MLIDILVVFVVVLIGSVIASSFEKESIEVSTKECDLHDWSYNATDKLQCITCNFTP